MTSFPDAGAPRGRPVAFRGNVQHLIVLSVAVTGVCLPMNYMCLKETYWD